MNDNKLRAFEVKMVTLSRRYTGMQARDTIIMLAGSLPYMYD